MFNKTKSLVFTITLISTFPAHSEVITTPTPAEPQKNYVSVQEDPKNVLGLAHWAKKIEDANILFNEGKYSEAEKLLLPIYNWLTTSTEYHYSLFHSLSKDNKTFLKSKIEKAHALDYAHIRDKSSFLLAKTYIKLNKSNDALKLLVEIVKSQAESDLGQEAYKLLQEIRFSDKLK